MKKQVKAYHSENEDHVIHFHHLMATRWGNNGDSEDLIFLGSKIPIGGDCSRQIQRCGSLEDKL